MKTKFVLRDNLQTEQQPLSSVTEEATTTDQTSELVTAAEVNNNLTKAFSIVQIDGHWMVLELEVNPETKQVGEWKLIPEDGSKSSAIERFKINVAETLM